MITVLSVFQALIAISIIVIVLLQKTKSRSIAGLASSSYGGATGKSSRFSTINKFMMLLSALFIINSLVLAKLSTDTGRRHNNLIENVKGIEDSKEKSKSAAPIIQ